MRRELNTVNSVHTAGMEKNNIKVLLTVRKAAEDEREKTKENGFY